MIIKNIRKRINGNTIFDNISFSLNTQDKVGLVGVNGSGKSTLLKVLGGIITTDNGVVDATIETRIDLITEALREL